MLISAHVHVICCHISFYDCFIRAASVKHERLNFTIITCPLQPKEMNGTAHHSMAGVWSPTNESLHVSILNVMDLMILIVSGWL